MDRALVEEICQISLSPAFLLSFPYVFLEKTITKCTKEFLTVVNTFIYLLLPLS